MTVHLPLSLRERAHAARIAQRSVQDLERAATRERIQHSLQDRLIEQLAAALGITPERHELDTLTDDGLPVPAWTAGDDGLTFSLRRDPFEGWRLRLVTSCDACDKTAWYAVRSLAQLAEMIDLPAPCPWCSGSCGLGDSHAHPG